MESLEIRQQRRISELEGEVAEMRKQLDEAKRGFKADALVKVANPWRLPPQRLELLMVLLAHPEGVSRDRIYAALYETRHGIDLPESRIIDSQISFLRKALAKGGHRNAIKTVRGLGYQIYPDKREALVKAVRCDPLDESTFAA